MARVGSLVRRPPVLLLLAGAVGCATSSPVDVGLENLAVSAVSPDVIVPGTALTLSGSSFVGPQWGEASIRLSGADVEVVWPARFVDFEHMVVDVSADMIDEIGDGARAEGELALEVVSAVDGDTYVSNNLGVDLRFVRSLTPEVIAVPSGTLLFVNDQVEIEGDGFLLGGDEGESVARVTGCFTPQGGGACDPVAPVEVPLRPRTPFSRRQASFPFKPAIAGIRPGTFTGDVTVINRHQGGPAPQASPVSVSYDLIESQITRVTPTAVSLGQYVVIEGGGFVGGEAGAITELDLVGTFQATGAPMPAPVSLTLIPEFTAGNRVRYVLSEQDAIGQLIDLRVDTGTFSGTITPIVEYGGDRVTGVGLSASFSIAPVRQVVFLDFRPTYVESLRAFGLRAVDSKVRERVLAVVDRAYQGVNMEFRTSAPDDYALFSHVELHGTDPNGQGLFGYDNTPGKDDNNVRLYDRLGGVNAATQQDGYPGFGGVFVESLMGFSLDPGRWAMQVPGADPEFDKIFDPFRSDRDGRAISSSDSPGAVRALGSGDTCPAASDDRGAQMDCAVFVLGNLIGGTLAHEIGHSLGLANPNAEGFHNNGDEPNRLMDSGGDRPFLERAELMGLGPGVFCDEEYAYLRMILPSSDPPPDLTRPPCY